MNPQIGDATTLLRQGIEAYNHNDPARARYLLSQSVQAEPRSEAAWLWLAAVTPDLREVELCLQNAAGLNQHNGETANRLAHVRAILHPAPAQPQPMPPPPPLPPSSYQPGRSLLSFGSTQPHPPPTAVAAPIPSAPLPPPLYQPPQPQYQPPASTMPARHYTPRPNPTTPLYDGQRQQPFILRALYFVFVGWWVTWLWVSFAWLFNLSIIGLPIGLLMLNLVPQVLTLEPQRTEFITVYSQTGRLSVRQVPAQSPPLLTRAIWFVLVGWWLSLLWTYVATFLCISVIGLPAGIWLFHRLPLITTLKRL